MANDIRTIRIGNHDLALDEWSHWPLYTTVESALSTVAAPIIPNLVGFSYTVGQNVPSQGGLPKRTADISDTNQAVRARINRDEGYIVFAMTYEVFALENTASRDNNSPFPVPPLNDESASPMLTGTNLRQMQMSLMLELYLGANITKPMASAPLSWYGQSAGTMVFGAGDAVAIANAFGATAINLNYGTAGELSASNQRSWVLPVEINSDTPMRSKLSCPAGAFFCDQDWRMRQYLDGIKRRPVIA
jgi:hypothetical protein